MKKSFEKIVIIDDHAYGITFFRKLVRRSSLKIGEDLVYLCVMPGKLKSLRFFMKKEYPNASIVDNTQPRYMSLERNIRESVEEYHNIIINNLSFPLHIWFIQDDTPVSLEVLGIEPETERGIIIKRSDGTILQEDSEKLNPITQVVRDAMKAVSEHVRLPKVVRDGIVKKKSS